MSITTRPETHIPRHARRARRWPWFTGAAVALLLLAGGTAFVLQRDTGSRPDTATRVAAPPATQPARGPAGETLTEPACRYEPATGGAASRPADRATLSGTVKVTLRTSRGPLALELDATKAPCTVNSFVNLARAGFYDDTACHRLTTVGIFVLQCGDPSATGTGTPGYRFDDENLPFGTVPAYPRGTLAMANAGPDTNGSQFFVVYRDSDIDPNYPVFGRVTAGLELIDEVAASGSPNNDGTPNLEIVVEGVGVS